MTVIQLSATPDPDGVIRLSIPIGPSGGEYDLAIILTPKPTGTGSKLAPPESRGWPPGYFEQTAGTIDDPAFDRGDQGEYDVRDRLP